MTQAYEQIRPAIQAARALGTAPDPEAEDTNKLVGELFQQMLESATARHQPGRLINVVLNGDTGKYGIVWRYTVEDKTASKDDVAPKKKTYVLIRVGNLLTGDSTEIIRPDTSAALPSK